jgi:hypothetical protein
MWRVIGWSSFVIFVTFALSILSESQVKGCLYPYPC